MGTTHRYPRTRKRDRLGLSPASTISGAAGHLWVIGRTRYGKSKAVQQWLLAAIGQGDVGVTVIDPNRDLYTDLVSYLSVIAARASHLAQRVVLINPLCSRWAAGFNPLQLWPGEVAERKCTLLADVVCQIFEDDSTVVVRMRRVMRYSFLALMELGLTLLELPRFLMERDFREALLHHVRQPEVRAFWLQHFPSDDREAAAWTSSTLNRLDPLLGDPSFKLIFGQLRSTINFRQVMDNGLWLLVNTDKGALTSENSRLLGAFLVAQEKEVAQRRVELPKSQRRRHILVMDEFQNYVSSAVATLLEESGKTGLTLWMLHQHLAQLTNEQVKAAVISQSSDLICFGIDEKDAQEMALRIFRPELDQVKYMHEKPMNWGEGVIESYPEITWRPNNEIWQIEERKLYGLPKRYFWHKRRGHKPGLYYSHDMPDIDVPEPLIRRLEDISGSLYALPQAKAVHHITVEREQLLTQLLSSQPPIQVTEGGKKISGEIDAGFDDIEIPPLWDE